MEDRPPSLTQNLESDPYIRFGQIGHGLVWPFDKANSMAGKVFVEPCIEELLGPIEPIKIKVVEV